MAGNAWQTHTGFHAKHGKTLYSQFRGTGLPSCFQIPRAPFTDGASEANGPSWRPVSPSLATLWLPVSLEY